jgi:hypothetical protein
MGNPGPDFLVENGEKGTGEPHGRHFTSFSVSKYLHRTYSSFSVLSIEKGGTRFLRRVSFDQAHFGGILFSASAKKANKAKKHCEKPMERLPHFFNTPRHSILYETSYWKYLFQVSQSLRRKK